MAGGNFMLTDGFWAFIAPVSTPGAPALRIWLTSTNTAIVTWPAPSTGSTLQHNPDVATPNWSEVTNAVNRVGSENQVIVMRPLRPQFYRLTGQ